MKESSRKRKIDGSALKKNEKIMENRNSDDIQT